MCENILMVHLVNMWWCDNTNDDIIFSLQVSSIWHPWLITKWHEYSKYHLKTWQCDHKIILQWLKNDYKLFNMSIDRHKKLWHVGNWLHLIFKHVHVI